MLRLSNYKLSLQVNILRDLPLARDGLILLAMGHKDNKFYSWARALLEGDIFIVNIPEK